MVVLVESPLMEILLLLPQVVQVQDIVQLEHQVAAVIPYITLFIQITIITLKLLQHHHLTPLNVLPMKKMGELKILLAAVAVVAISVEKEVSNQIQMIMHLKLDLEVNRI